MSEPQPLTPDEVKSVAFYGDTLAAALVRVEGEDRIYVPLRPVVEALGLDWSAQTRRLRRDDVLADGVRGVAIMATPGPGGGTQAMLCLPLDLLPGWLFGIDAGRVKPELREKITRYRRECFRVLWRAFQPQIAPALPQPTPSGGAELAYQLATAVANLAREQMDLETRMTRAAQWAQGIEQRVSALELSVSPAAPLSEAEAAELAGAVKNVAAALEAGGAPNGYQRVYGELYRRYGITSYKNLARGDLAGALAWLKAWHQETTEGEGGQAD